MHPYSPKFAGGVSDTVLHPVVLVAMLVAMLCVVVLPRRHVIVPVLFSTFLIPLGQQIYVAGIHLFVSRIVILVALTRALTSVEPKQKSRYGGGWNSIDTAFITYVMVSAVATMVLYPSAAALINQIGYLWDYLLGYLLLRSLIRDKQDALLAIRCLAWLAILLAIAMSAEQVRRLNVFGLLGGVPAIPELRDGKIRAQAAFAHALTAGTFAATAIPLFLLLWKNGKDTTLSIAAVLSATLMTVDTRTSTSLLTYAGGLCAVFMWPLRKKMKTIRLSAIAAIIGLDIVMKAPVWFLIAHVDLTGSSSSYQRALLIDQFINHFSSWWLVGTKDAATWGWDMWDTQNMYVSVGEAGGMVAFVAFILVISRCFKKIGVARKQAESKKDEWFVWLLGAALFSNVVAFFGVNYFDQVRLEWFALISMICACTAPVATIRRSTEFTANVYNLKFRTSQSVPKVSSI